MRVSGENEKGGKRLVDPEGTLTNRGKKATMRYVKLYLRLQEKSRVSRLTVERRKSGALESPLKNQVKKVLRPPPRKSPLPSDERRTMWAEEVRDKEGKQKKQTAKRNQKGTGAWEHIEKRGKKDFNGAGKVNVCGNLGWESAEKGTQWLTYQIRERRTRKEKKEDRAASGPDGETERRDREENHNSK